MDEVISTSRRSLVRGAAWSVPVIAATTAAPAFAASPCPAVTLAWASLGNGTTFSSTTVGGVVVTLAVTGQTGAANNRTVSTTATGGQTSNLRFYSTNANGSAQTATIGFTRNGQAVSVLNLGFSFLDIDSAGTLERQRVGRHRRLRLRDRQPTYVRGAGTVASPFRANGNNTSSARRAPSPTATSRSAGRPRCRRSRSPTASPGCRAGALHRHLEPVVPAGHLLTQE